jgi:hypothetical protein
MLVITFETNKRNTNVAHISNEKTFTTLKTLKNVRMYHTNSIGAVSKKRIFSSSKCIFRTPPKSVEQITGTFPIGFYLPFRSPK